MDETENLTEAVADWVNEVLPRLSQEQRQLFDAMLDGRCDVAIEVRLRKGTVTMRAIDEAQGRFNELYRVDVAPLRPAGHPAPPDRSQ
jgi:hypothetical protein